jgi:photosystem II stability/assembly factor-like uncharacterized protein/thiol-disulfide isomerase/thioredoxin
MKKLILFLLLTFLTLTSFLNLSLGIESGTKRKVLLELFTATWCGPCAKYGPYADETYNIYGSDKVILLRNQVWNDGLDTEETNNRCSFYGVDGVPTLYVNGKYEYHPANYQDYRKKIDDILKTNSPISIKLNPIITSGATLGNLYITIEVLDNINLKEPHLLVTLYEKLVNYEGPNKEKTHKFVIRDYIYDDAGEVLNLKKGDILKFNFPFKLKQNVNPNDFGIAVWIQDFQTLEVIQAESSNINIISNLTPPVIISPKNQQIFVGDPLIKFLSNSKKIKFQISDKEDFSNILVDQESETNEYEFKFAKEKVTYYLRAKAKEEYKESDWSDIVVFLKDSSKKIYSFIDINYNLYGGNLTSIVQDPKNPDILYIGSYGGGVYKSIDKGKTWFRASFGLESLYVNSLDIDKNNTNIILAATNGGVYISFNGGNSWTNYGLSNIKKIKISYDSTTIFALSSYNLYKSGDYGKTWIDITPKFSDYNYYFLEFCVDFKNKDIIFLSGYFYNDSKSKLFKTNNGGSSWSEIKINLSKYSDIDSIIIDPNNSDIIYLATDGDGLFKSNDGGKSFNSVNSPYKWLEKIKINSINTNILYCSSYSQLWISKNNGDSWITIYNSSDNIRDFINDFQNEDFIYLVKNCNEGLFVSENNGLSWNVANIGINSNKILGISNFKDTFVQTNSGLYKLEEKNWSKINKEYSNYGNLFINIKYPDEFYYFNDYNVYYSNNSGISWFEPIYPPENTYIISFTVDFGNKLIYAIVYNWENRKFILYKVNLFNEWQKIEPQNLPLNYPPYNMFITIDPNNPQILYIGMETYWDRDSSGNWVIKGGGLYKSTDSGKNWKLISLKEIGIYKIFIDPKDSKNVYVSTNKGFKRSNDGGLTWKNLFNENVDTMTFHPNKPVIFANRGRNLIKSEDNGLTWKYITWDYSINFIKFSKITYLSIDINDPNSVYIGTDGCGIYKYSVLETEKELVPPSSPTLDYQIKDNSILLKWTKSQDGSYPVSGYSLYKKKENFDWYLLRNFSKDTFEYEDFDIEPGKTYSYYIQSFDTQGNLSEKSNIITINITLKDTTPPLLEITSPQTETYLTNNSKITISGKTIDNESGIKKLLINNNEIPINQQGYFNYQANLNEGENSFLIISTDKENNETRKIIKIICDLTPPQISVNIPNETNEPTLLISGSIVDNISGVKYLKINNINISISLDNKFSYSLNLSEGTNNILIESEDNAGNKISKKYTIKYIKRITIILQVGNRYININGLDKEIDVAPKIIEGRTYLPIRYIVEPLGGETLWDSQEKKVTILFKDILIELWIGKNIAKVNGFNTQLIQTIQKLHL